MKIIELTRGQAAIVDDEDYEMLMQWKWHAYYSRFTKSYYAGRSATVAGRRTTISMHRVILEAKKGEQVDHQDHDTLNNQRYNIKLTTCQGNQMNARQRRDNTSGFCGVIWYKSHSKWVAKIIVGGKRVYLGIYDNKADAIAARQAANIKYGFHENHGSYHVAEALTGSAR